MYNWKVWTYRGGSVREWCRSCSCGERGKGLAAGGLPQPRLQRPLLHQDPRPAQTSLSLSRDQEEHCEKPNAEHSPRESSFLHTFCESFNSEERKARKKGIRFLFKQTQDSIKVCAQSDAVDIPFTLTFYDKKGFHLSSSRIKGLSGSRMYPVDAKVFKEVGKEVKFKIEVDKWPELPTLISTKRILVFEWRELRASLQVSTADMMYPQDPTFSRWQFIHKYLWRQLIK